MKQKIILTIGLFQLCLNGWGQQAPTPYTTPYAGTPAQAVITANAAWYRGGNSPGGTAGNANIFGTNAGFNSPIYTVTNGVNRMTLMGDSPTGSITGALGLGTSVPLGYLHLSNFTLGLNSPQGVLFRTDGNRTNANHWKMFTGTTATNSTEKFRITSIANSGAVELGTVQSGLLHLITNNTRRISILGNSMFPYNRTGFVGFNNQAPLFHLDINTQEPDGNVNYGELLLRARIVDDPDAYISFVNIATDGPLFVPTLLARQSDNDHSALNTIGSINSNQDLAVNQIPITRFFSTINYDPTIPSFGLSRANVVENRRLFGWYNGVDQLMTMESNGFLGVATTNPGNRVEINSDFYDATTGNPLGTAGSGPLVTATTNNGQPGLGGTNATGFSGLRFSDLKSNSIPYLTNPGNGVLALDSIGDVIYVNATNLGGGSGSSGGFGAACADSINGKLQFDTKVDLNNHNFYFTKNDSLDVNHVGIGYDCSLALPGKLSVLQYHPTSVAIGTVAIDAHNEDIANTMPLTFYGTKTLVDGDQILPRITHIGGDFTARNAQINIGMNALVSNSSFENATDFGVVSEVKDDSALVTYGGWFTGKGGSNSNWGIYASAAPQDVNSGQPSLLGYGGRFASANHQKRNVGVWGIASDDFPSAYHQQSECFGVVGIAKKGASNYAVYGEVEPGTNNYAGYFAGPVVMNQSAIWSDENLKENIDNLELADSLLNLINPVTFTYKQTGDAERLNLPEGTRYGMIAQQVEQVFPNFVTIAKHPAELDSAGNIISAAFEYKVLDLEQFIPVILKDAQLKNEKIENLEDEVNAQDSLINDLNNRLTQLENCLSNILPALCNANSMAVQSTPAETQEHLEKAINVTLSNRYNIVLNQNVPNPFAESTIITYSIPATVQKAQIHFYDGTGKLINSVDIIERGNGQLNVFANDLSTGVYTYSLVADGQIVSTKRMMKQ